MGNLIPNILPDKELLRLIAEDRPEALEQLMFRYEDRVFSFALRILKSQDIAEEITQDIFIYLWNNRHTLPDIESLPAWLYTISRNKSLNLLKEIANRHLREDAFASSRPLTADLEDTMHHKDYERLLSLLMDKLPQRRREIFRLKFEKGWTNERIGQHLHISSNTVKNQLTKSYQLLKKELTGTFLILIVITLTR